MYKARITDKEFKVSINGNDYKIDDVSLPADIIKTSEYNYHFLLNNRSYSAEILSIDKESKICIVKIGSKELKVHISDKYDELLSNIGIAEMQHRKVIDIKAPMPGMVLQVMVEAGQKINKGDAIVVLEAMKMENILKSPADGIIKKIHITMGDKIEKNQVMVNLE